MELFQTRPRIFISFLFLLSLITSSNCAATDVVDGVTEWKHPTITIGDSIIFKHKYNHNLYIFRSKTAFNLCNFTQATLLTDPNSPSYTWRPSRVGYFYFSFKPCQSGTKLAIKVVPQPTTTSAPPPTVAAPAPPPSSGGDDSSFPWPFLPHEKSGGPVSSPGPIANAMAPLDGKGGIMPFIASNPAVPLPASEVDSSGVFPLPTSAIKNHAMKMQMMSQFGNVILQCIWIVMIL